MKDDDNKYVYLATQDNIPNNIYTALYVGGCL